MSGIVEIREVCRARPRGHDRAISSAMHRTQSPICIHGYGGLAVFPILCLTEPDYVAELH